jgi:NADH-quinone oxidoreductase subunit J
MNAALALLALLMLASAAVALSLRNIVRSTLLFVVNWFGVALFYLWAGAEFVAFAQMIVYVGAVSMVTLFAVLLTRRSLDEPEISAASRARASAAITTAGAVAGVLSGAIATARFPAAPAALPVVTVRQIGLELMGPQAAGLLVVGVILTVALIGAVVIASTDREESP